MAATFVVETGAGVAGANSYMTEAQADQYHDNIGTAPASWTGLASPDKQQALRDATRYLDAKYGERWKGVRSTSTNPLDWPRRDVVDSDRFHISSTTIPQALLDATAEAALRSRDTTQNPNGLTPDITGAGTITYKRERAEGAAEEETHYDHAGVSQYVTFTVIDRLLHDLIESKRSITLVRA